MFFYWYFHNIVFISMKFLVAVFLPASLFILTFPFINFEDFCKPPRLLHPPRLLFWPKFSSLTVCSALPFYLKLETTYIHMYLYLHSHIKISRVLLCWNLTYIPHIFKFTKTLEGEIDRQTDKNGCFHWTLISPSWNLNCWAQLQELIAVYQGHIWNPKILDGLRFS